MTTMRTHLHDDCRDDESDVLVRFTFSPGRVAQTYGPPENCYPAEPAEVEIISAVDNDGQPVLLTLAEKERISTWLVENFEDDGPDPDDARDEAYDRERW